MNLDRHALEEERRWRMQHYKEQVRKLGSTLVNAIEHEVRDALEREIRYDDDGRADYNWIDQAGHIQHAIIQALNNADFGGLTRDAGELHAVCMAIHTLPKLKESMPADMRGALEQAEDDRLRGRIEEKVARLEEIEERERNRCQAAVHQGGRGVGFHRCSFKAKDTRILDRWGKLDPEGEEVGLCTRHLKEVDKGRGVHLHRLTEWEAGQALAYRKKTTAEIAAMRRQLGELPSGEPIQPPLELTEGGDDD